MDVIIEINSRSGSSTTNRKNCESNQEKLQHLEQLQSQCLSNWKMKTFKSKSIERTSIDSSKTKGITKSQHNKNNNNTKLSELVTTNKNPNFISEGETNNKKIQNTEPLSRLEMNYIDSVNRELIESSSKMFTTNPRRVMSAHKCSDIYKDVINSLINENLLSYSKYYEDFIDTNNSGTELTSNSDDLESFNYQNSQTVSTKGKHKSRNSSIINMRSALKLNRRRATTSKVATFSDLVDVNSQSLARSKKSFNTEPSHDRDYKRPATYSYTKKLNRSFNDSPEVFEKSLNLSGSFTASKFETKRRAVSSHVIGDQRISNQKDSSQLRLTDLIFDGYERKISKDSSVAEINTIEEEEFEVHRNTRTYKDISPYFKIKLYDISDRKELELAKEDLYKRYSKFNESKKILKEEIKAKRNQSNFSDKNNKVLPSLIKQI